LRVLIISDIHANLEALEACLGAAPSFDRVVNLGDIVGYGASPNEVSEHARKRNAITIRGNHDKACAGLMGLESFNPIAGMAVLWTVKELSPENLDWLRTLPPGPVTLPTSNGGSSEATSPANSVQLVHGSPLDEDEYIIVMRDAQEPLMRSEVPLTFFGHTHIQGGFSERNQRWETLRPICRSRQSVAEHELGLDPGAKYLINPGSIGQPRDGDQRAAFAMFDTDKYAVTFYRVPYDVERAQSHIFAARLPERLATRLAEGR
jgi:predicted phosphodiesterase